MKAKKHIRGQTALVMILVATIALMFLAVTLNWGRISQVKTTTSMAAYEAAALLASDTASYGEMEKQTNLQDVNKLSQTNWFSFFMMIFAIALAIFSCGQSFWVAFLAIAAAVMSVANFVLQVTVIMPGISSLWNSLQKNQPLSQQIYEGGLATALQGAVTDQALITDYLDENTNGKFGTIIPVDVISRFALFYTDRLKMLNKGDIRQVDFFDSQLQNFINGETCWQNYQDNQNYPAIIPLNTNCEDALGVDYCVTDSTDPLCRGPIPDGFQLNDSCTDSDPTSPTYNPYCDPCCQPMVVGGKGARPATCFPYVGTAKPYPAICYSNPIAQGCTPTSPTINSNPNPSYDPINAGYGAPPQCTTAPPTPSAANPYNTYGSYPLLYDKTYQEYADELSFLDRFGRDLPMMVCPNSTPPVVCPVSGTCPDGSQCLPPDSINVQGNFPNGIYPYFYLMDPLMASPEVDNLDSTTLTPAQYHWCSTDIAPAAPAFPASSAFAGPLGQLLLQYACSGKDCCVNFLLDTTPLSSSKQSKTITVTVGAKGSGPTVTINSPANGSTWTAGSNLNISVTAKEAAPGSIAEIDLTYSTAKGSDGIDTSAFNYNPPVPAASTTMTGAVAVPSCSGSTIVSGSITLTAVATDAYGNQATKSVKFTIKAAAGTTCTAADNCGQDICNNQCGSLLGACPAGKSCNNLSGGPGQCK